MTRMPVLRMFAADFVIFFRSMDRPIEIANAPDFDTGNEKKIELVRALKATGGAFR